MFKWQKPREITDLEKNEIIIEYLKDKLELYTEHAFDIDQEIKPAKLIEIILDFEERKRKYMLPRTMKELDTVSERES